MHTSGTQSMVIEKSSLSLPQKNKSSDADSEIIFKLEQKRRRLDEEIADFRAQKEREFNEFEHELRQSRRRKVTIPPTPPSSLSKEGNSQPETSSKPPSRTSSSSALNLLAGRVAPKTSSTISSPKKPAASTQKKTASNARPSVSQPVVSLDKLNIKGENAAPSAGRPRTPPTPTLLSRTLTRSSSGSSLATSPPPKNAKRRSSPKPTVKAAAPISPDEDKYHESLTGLFTPSYIELLNAKPAKYHQSSSALETPPAEDEAATAPSSYNTLGEILPLSSSSYPPHVTISPGGHTHASKRAYTAPTVPSSRIPSALRTASTGNLGRKPKHVTFRLADSAIVEPSSSYEEGPSPDLDDASAERQAPGTRSPMHKGKGSQLYRTMSPDEEDEEAGVLPGMGMGDVIQRLNDYTVAEAAKHGEDLILEVEDIEEDDEDDSEDDDQDVPMEIADRHEDHLEEFTVNYHEHEDSPKAIEEDGYFSPKSKHISSMSPIRRGSSPIVPYRDDNWGELSSSDKDRLLFQSRRHSDDSDIVQRRRNPPSVAPAVPTETGFTGGLRQSLDGGSGVGFFELDEELASPDAGQARPFQFEVEDDPDVPETNIDKEIERNGMGLSATTKGKEIAIDAKRWSGESASKFGIGSVPIDIVRPSSSVSSSWVGTFGH